MDNGWKEKLRDRLQDYEETEPEGLWQAISDAMDKGRTSLKPVPVPKQGRSSAVRYVVTALSAAAAIIIAVYFSFTGNRDSHPDGKGTIAVVTDTASAQKPVQPTTERVKTSGIQDRIPAAHNLVAENHAPASAGRSGLYMGDGYTDIPESTVNEDSMPNVPDDRDLEPDTIRQDNHKKEEDMDCPGIFEGKGYLDAERPARKPRKGTFHASVSSSSLVGTTASFSGYSGLASASVLSVSKDKDEFVQTRSAVSPRSNGTGLSGNPYNTEIRHRQPVRMGVSARYDFTKRWGVETGLTYSMLSSTTSTGGSGYSSRAEQKLHYIGIPLQISYEFLQLKWFSMYVNAGGMMEKCISGETVTDYIPEGETAFETREDIHEKPVQWSLNAAIGAEVHFTPFLGLYVEPGAGYFFNDGSSISTIYKERPFNFNFEFGFRFTFR